VFDGRTLTGPGAELECSPSRVAGEGQDEGREEPLSVYGIGEGRKEAEGKLSVSCSQCWKYTVSKKTPPTFLAVT